MTKTIYVVPCFVDGEIGSMAAYEDIEAAQAALRRHVAYDELLSNAARENPGADEGLLNKIAFGAIDETRYAGSVVYEIPLE